MGEQVHAVVVPREDSLTEEELIGLLQGFAWRLQASAFSGVPFGGTPKIWPWQRSLRENLGRPIGKARIAQLINLQVT